MVQWQEIGEVNDNSKNFPKKLTVLTQLSVE